MRRVLSPSLAQVELYDVQFEGSPATNGVHVGDTLKTKVRKKDGSKYSYIDRTDNATYQWQYANTSSSDDPAYTDIPGATEATYTVDAAYAGKYLRVKVASENTRFQHAEEELKRQHAVCCSAWSRDA